MTRKAIADAVKQIEVEVHTSKEIEQWQTARLKPHKRNAKAHPPEQIKYLARLIREHGFDQPIVVDAKGTIIKGHGRWLAAQSLKLVTVPVIVREDLNAARVAEARIADNRVAEFGWDQDALVADVVEGLKIGIDPDLIGFDLKELGLAVDDAAEHTIVALDDANDDTDEEPDDEELPEPPLMELPKKARVKDGQVWLLGEHRVVCGDSFVEEVRRKVIKSVADLIVTDPPYAIYGSSTGIGADIADDKMVRPFFENLFAMAKNVLRRG